MTPEAEKIKEKLNRVYIDRDSLTTICKDRLDFGFDSIYFRYATIRDELAYYKARYDRTDFNAERTTANVDKMHFYNVLERLACAHKSDSQFE